MEHFEIELISIANENVAPSCHRPALCCGFFVQVSHKECEKGGSQDNQAMCFHINTRLSTCS
ncbi:hypothetical protein BKA82DRAFT_4177743 [Pisolithus tinctorius]|nr:hypothetical protein BKA82DRAFT_4177743 [Pisolithus tinctorius]